MFGRTRTELGRMKSRLECIQEIESEDNDIYEGDKKTKSNETIGDLHEIIRLLDKIIKRNEPKMILEPGDEGYD